MLNNKFLTVIFFFILLFFGSCQHQTGDLPAPDTGGSGNGDGGTGGGGTTIPCDSSKVYFKQQVLPVLISNCAMSGCHDDASHQDGVILTSYEKVMATADIRPGRPANSELYEVLVESDPDKRMPRPPANPLPQSQVQLIKTWIEQGALNLSCQSSCDTTQFTYSATIKSIIANNCQGCHSGISAQGGIDLSTYAGVKMKIDDGRLWGAINHSPGFSAMPKNGNQLAACELTQIRKWIEAGSPNN